MQVSRRPVGFIKELEDQEVEEFRDVVLACEVSSDDANVKWIKYAYGIHLNIYILVLFACRGKNTEIEPDDKYAIKAENRKRSLVIREASFDDEVVYTCQVDNEVKTSARISVTGKPFSIEY